jgi:cell wall-associated NlpC family hydrolase
MRLRAKGYYKGKVNGKYDAATKAAVSDYQLVAKLTRDGMAGPATLSSLFSSKAPKADPKVIKAATATPAPAAATPAPTKAPKPAATPKPSSASSSKADKVIAAAKAKLGKPYVFGAVGPNSYDCSGLTMYAYKTVGLSLPHSAYLVGYNVGKKVSRNQLKRGDIVCFNTVADSDLSDHVGIYLGGGSFLHASSGQGRVVISSLTGYYARVFSWGRSVF